MDIVGCEIKITGIVQGVGFRPFIYNLAKSLFLKGYVSNTSYGVIILVEASKNEIDKFINYIKVNCPPLSKINDIAVNFVPIHGFLDFTIKKSISTGLSRVYISPDVAICSSCTSELFDKNDRHYLYPFINCTNCGPRFTIITGFPYDRDKTTMSSFKMCKDCAIEYDDYLDRRYHAQPIACPDCGPTLTVMDNNGGIKKSHDEVQFIRKQILKGNIVAIKGLGGYHLVCDAKNESAIKKLRKRKIRDDKPFAVMMKDFNIAGKYCHINIKEQELLTSWKRPIVLLMKAKGAYLSNDIAPGNKYLGVMLPYTPLQLLLFQKNFRAKVITRRS